jgi:hypothetical protein
LGNILKTILKSFAKCKLDMPRGGSGLIFLGQAWALYFGSGLFGLEKITKLVGLKTGLGFTT